jgi:hypothetical protein
MTKQKKTEKLKKVVITREHFEALELLAGYGADLLCSAPPKITKGDDPFNTAERVIGWASDVYLEVPDPKDKAKTRQVAAAIRLFNQAPSPEEYVEPVKA